MNSTALISIEKKHKWPSATASNELMWSQLSSLISSLSRNWEEEKKIRKCVAPLQGSSSTLFFARAHSKVNFLLFPLLHRSLIPFNELNFFCEYFVCGWKTEAICFSRERGNQVKLVFFSFTFNVTTTAGFFCRRDDVGLSQLKNWPSELFLKLFCFLFLIIFFLFDLMEKNKFF